MGVWWLWTHPLDRQQRYTLDADSKARLKLVEVILNERWLKWTDHKYLTFMSVHLSEWYYSGIDQYIITLVTDHMDTVVWKEMRTNIWGPAFQCYRSTTVLESSHNHILMYAGKRFGFSPPVYGARVLLAALDYNRHLWKVWLSATWNNNNNK